MSNKQKNGVKDEKSLSLKATHVTIFQEDLAIYESSMINKINSRMKGKGEFALWRLLLFLLLIYGMRAPVHAFYGCACVLLFIIVE